MEEDKQHNVFISIEKTVEVYGEETTEDAKNWVLSNLWDLVGEDDIVVMGEDEEHITDRLIQIFRLYRYSLGGGDND